jgi:dihydrolipoamide dehydrogenase
VYAIGDVSGGPYLAHKASKEGEIAAEVIAGHKARATGARCPRRRSPPRDRLGGPVRARGEGQGARHHRGQVPLRGERARDGRDGDRRLRQGDRREAGRRQQDDYKVIGVHIVGPEASDLISEGALAMEMDAFVEDIGLTIHPHPRLGEAVMEAAKAVRIGEAVHMLKTE